MITEPSWMSHVTYNPDDILKVSEIPEEMLWFPNSDAVNYIKIGLVKLYRIKKYYTSIRYPASLVLEHWDRVLRLTPVDDHIKLSFLHNCYARKLVK